MKDNNSQSRNPDAIYTRVDHYVVVEDRHIPILAFFGTKGGVGKTTIVDKFSTLVSRAPKSPNVLIVDFDVYHRGLTVLRTKNRPWGCRTIHQYLTDERLEFQGAVDITPSGYPGAQGREFLIPSSDLAAEKVFNSLARLKPAVLVQRITNLLNAAAVQYHIDLIVVDCGPIVDPLTASAAFMSDMAFIIGQNEPITFSSLQNYAIQIRDFFQNFDGAKVRVILNKVRGPISQKGGIYAAIPFTMEVVDYSEGLSNIDEIRLIYLDYSVHGIISSAFKERYADLVPGYEAVVTAGQRKVIDTVDSYMSAKWYLRLKKMALLLFAGCGSLIFAVITSLLPKFLDVSDEPVLQWLEEYLPPGLLVFGLLFGGVGAVFYWRLRQANSIIRLKQKMGYEGLLKLVSSKKGRKKFDLICKLSEKTDKEKSK